MAKRKPVKAKVGRPSLYRPEYDEQARRACMLMGATVQELAGFFSVSDSTIEEWMRTHESFSRAVKEGRSEADADVAHKLFRRATGYSHDAVKIITVADGNNSGSHVEQVPYVEHYPPDTTAAIFWLKNRNPQKWRDLKAVEHTGKDGGPIETVQKWTFGNKSVEF